MKTLLILLAVYFCSPTGSGDGTSYSTPCSLSNGLKKLNQGGDTLYCLAGQYNLSSTTSFSKSGSAGANIVIAAYPGEEAILDYRQTSYGSRGLCVSGRYVHIKGLTIRYSGKNNLYCDGSYCTFENLDIYGSADTGCQMKGSGGHNLILNCDSHDNFDYQLGGTGSCDFGGNADGFADKQYSGAGNTYRGCRAWNNSDDGWDCFQRVTTGSETIIEDCICYRNGPATYDMRNHARYNTDKAWFDQFQNGRNVTDKNGQTHYVTLERYYNNGNGNGFKLGGDGTSHNVTVHHCLAVSNKVKGFDQNNNFGTMKLYNNTGYWNATDFGFNNPNGGTLYIRNNISLRGSNSIGVMTVMQNDHNTWNNNYATNADFVSLDTTLVRAARQANGELAVTDLLHLTKTSKFVDAGVNVGYTYCGSAPDMGCYETDAPVNPRLTITAGTTEQWVMRGAPIRPVVVSWIGCDDSPTYSVPEGITVAVDAEEKTLTFSGSCDSIGEITMKATTACDSKNVSIYLTLHVCPTDYSHVAYVTLPDSESDEQILERLQHADSVLIDLIDANIAQVDYTPYDLIIIAGAPNSSAAGIMPLKTVNKPRLILKTFYYKASVWDWCTPANTALDEMIITDPSHPIFEGLTSPLKVFTEVNTNGVTTMSAWKVSPTTTLATADGKDAIVAYDNTLTIGISEASTMNMTGDGINLIENSMWYMLGRTKPTPQTAVEQTEQSVQAKRILSEGRLYLHRAGQLYTIHGQRID